MTSSDQQDGPVESTYPTRLVPSRHEVKLLGVWWAVASVVAYDNEPDVRVRCQGFPHVVLLPRGKKVKVRANGGAHL